MPVVQDVDERHMATNDGVGARIFYGTEVYGVSEEGGTERGVQQQGVFQEDNSIWFGHEGQEQELARPHRLQRACTVSARKAHRPQALIRYRNVLAPAWKHDREVSRSYLRAARQTALLSLAR